MMKKKKSKFVIAIEFLLFEFIFTIVTGGAILFYGPFNTVRKMFVGAAMTTANHKYLATTFLSQKRIDEILHGDSAAASTNSNGEEQDINMIKVDNSHSDKVEKFTIKGKKFDGYILLISDPTRVKIGYTKKMGKEGERTSKIAEDHNAVAAINGGGFSDNTGGSWGGTAAIPSGILMVDGKSIYNSVDESCKCSTVGFDSKGRMYVGKHSINELKSLGVKDALSFDLPGVDSILLVNGKSQIRGDGGAGPAPRTAIGQREDGTVVMLVVDGRQLLKNGATLQDLVQIMLEQKVKNAINLDGGSSTTMYYDGEVVNNPSDIYGERVVNNAFYVLP